MYIHMYGYVYMEIFEFDREESLFVFQHCAFAYHARNDSPIRLYDMPHVHW